MKPTFESSNTGPEAPLQLNVKSNSLPYKHKISPPAIPPGPITDELPVVPVVNLPPLPDEKGIQRVSTAESFNAYEQNSEPIVNPRHSVCTMRSRKNSWNVYTDSDGVAYYAHPNTSEKWFPAHSSDGQLYFYEAVTRKSAWTLPSLRSESSSQSEEAIPSCVFTAANRTSTTFNRPTSAFSETPTFTTIDLSTAKEKFGARTQVTPTKNAFGWFGEKKRQPSENPDLLSPTASVEEDSEGQYAPHKISKDHITGPIEQKIRNTERRGAANRTIYSENGNVVSKKWIPSQLVLSGPVLQIYKDVKNQKGANQLGKPELELHVKNLSVEIVTDKSITSRENVLLLRDTVEDGGVSEYLLEMPSAILLRAWQTAFRYSKELVDENRFEPLAFSSHPPPSVDSKIIVMLQNFFRRRPPIEAVRASGILQNEPVFGSNLIELCTREKSKVPNFVIRVIRAIESRGLDAEGVFRKSGSACVIQKLRNEVNHHEYSLNSSELGIYELSDSLKLFLRELKEPLLSFSIYERLVNFYQTLKYRSVDENILQMREILQSMPECHLATTKALFHHLHKVSQHSSKNQMPSCNLALLISPNVMWPENLSSHFSDYASAGFCCTEFLIDHCSPIFSPETSI